MLEHHGDHARGNSTGAALMDRMSQEVAALLGDAAAQDMTAIVDTRTSFKGVIRYTGTVRIDGKVEGEIHTNGVLLIGREAVIRARVSAGTIVSCGTIFGNVTATDRVSLLQPAVLKGSVKTPSLSMEEGVRLIGTTDMPEDEAESSNILGVKDEEEVARAG
jgi:cytoskeletal protein CcmA (bactofilin family)